MTRCALLCRKIAPSREDRVAPGGPRMDEPPVTGTASKMCRRRRADKGIAVQGPRDIIENTRSSPRKRLPSRCAHRLDPRGRYLPVDGGPERASAGARVVRSRERLACIEDTAGLGTARDRAVSRSSGRGGGSRRRHRGTSPHSTATIDRRSRRRARAQARPTNRADLLPRAATRVAWVSSTPRQADWGGGAWASVDLRHVSPSAGV